MDLIDTYHKLDYDSGGWYNTTWCNVNVQKSPYDILRMNELISKVRPTVIIETGTMHGGSAYMYATFMDILKIKGKVYSIDIVDRVAELPKYKTYINYIIGSSTDTDLVDELKSKIRSNDVVMVILDSDHRMDHVLREMYLYAELVTVGSYMIVEDGNINGHPVLRRWGAGPYEALEKFLVQDEHFEIDTDIEHRYLFTYFPSGFLKKIK